MPLQRWKPLDKHQAPRLTSQRGQPLLDEVIFTNIDLHIEQMDEKYYWMGISEPGGNALHFGFHLEGEQIEFVCVEQLPPGKARPPDPAVEPEPPPPPQVVGLEVPGDLNLAALDELLADFGCRLLKPRAKPPE